MSIPYSLRSLVKDLYRDCDDGQVLVKDEASPGGVIPGSAARLQKYTIGFADLVNVVDGASPFWGAVLTVPAGNVVLDGYIVIEEAFDDTGLLNGDTPTIENYDNDTVYIVAADGPDTVTEYDAHGLRTPALVTGELPSQPLVFGPAGGSVIFNIGGTPNGDGTTGIAHVYLLIASAP